MRSQDEFAHGANEMMAHTMLDSRHRRPAAGYGISAFGYSGQVPLTSGIPQPPDPVDPPPSPDPAPSGGGESLGAQFSEVGGGGAETGGGGSESGGVST